jgi:putative acetyltransferase
MIREMHEGDMRRIEEIWLEDSVRAHNFVPDAANFWHRRLPFFLRETRAAIAYVCEARGAVNGFITMRGKDHYIYSLYVDFHLRGHGIGAALLDKAKAMADRLHLHVYRKDVDAVCFYVKQGFVVVDPAYGPEKETAEFKYHMEWKGERPGR